MPCGPDLGKHLNTCLRDLLNWMLLSPLAPSTCLLAPWLFGSVSALGCSCCWKLGPSPSLQHQRWGRHASIASAGRSFLCYFAVGDELAVPTLIPAGRSMLWCVGPHHIVLSCWQPHKAWSSAPLACCPLPATYLLVARVSRRGPPSRQLHSSAVTPCPEQPHAAEGPNMTILKFTGWMKALTPLWNS